MSPLSETDVRPRVEAAPSGVEIPGRSKSWERSWSRLPGTARHRILILGMLGTWQAYVSIYGIQPLVLPGPVDVSVAF